MVGIEPNNSEESERALNDKLDAARLALKRFGGLALEAEKDLVLAKQQLSEAKRNFDEFKNAAADALNSLDAVRAAEKTAKKLLVKAGIRASRARRAEWAKNLHVEGRRLAQQHFANKAQEARTELAVLEAASAADAPALAAY